jgi:hypothetical protein
VDRAGMAVLRDSVRHTEGISERFALYCWWL